MRQHARGLKVQPSQREPEGTVALIGARLISTAAIAAIGCAVVFCLFASPAFAAKGVVGFFGSEGIEGGQFSNPGGAAVNQNGTGGASAGDVYVVDRGNKRVQQFEADGTWVRAFGLGVNPLNEGAGGLNVCEVASSCAEATGGGAAGAMNAPQGIAIEQTTGNLYVSDQGNRRIDVFSAEGVFEGAFGWKVKVTGAAEELQLCSVETECQAAKAGADAGQFQSLGQTVGFPALSPQNGHLFLADKGNRRIDEFETTQTAGKVTGASFVRGFGWKVNKEAPAEEFQTCTTASHCQIGLGGSGSGQFGSSSPTALAIDTTGRLYALDAANQRVQAFSSTRAPEGVFAAAALSGEPAPVGLTVDPSNDHLLAIKPFAGEERVLELDPAGNLLEIYGKEAGIPAANAIASASGGGDIYLTTSSGLAGAPGFFLISSSAPTPPGASIEAVSNFTPFTATFEGHVNPGNWETAYRFEYSTDGSSWTRVPVKVAGEDELPGDNTEHAVSAEAEDLEGSTEYQVKLVATKRFDAGSATAETSFETAASAPIVSGTTHSHLHDTSAQLQGTINPENQETEYSFQYVDRAHFEAEGFTNAKSTPVPPGELSGGKALEVKAQLTGLSPAMTYHYRLIATNPTGSPESPALAFTTYSSPQVFEPCSGNEALRTGFGVSLPDCRAYEQASPVDKNGGTLQAFPYSTKASVNGDAISFESAAGIPGGEGSQEFPTYVARRSEGGWSTQGMLPPASAGEGAVVLGWTPDFAQVFDSASKSGLGTALLSRSSAGGSLATIAPYADTHYSFDTTSANGSVVLFRASGELPLAIGSPVPVASENLYAWDRDAAQLYLASVLPDGFAPAGESEAPNGSDGYRRDMHAVADDGSAYFTELQSGQLYLRENPTEPEATHKDGEGNCVPDPVLACTVHVSASQKTVTDPDGPQPATFQGASADGSKALFTSPEELTDDAHTIAPPNVISSASLNGTGIQPSFIPGANAAALVVDADHIYWADNADDSIGRADLDGENPDPNFITGADNPKGVAVDGSHIYWTNAADGGFNTGSIGRATIGGGEVNQSCITGLTNPTGIDLDANYVYWVNAGAFAGSGNGASIGRADLACTPASVEQELIVSDNPNDIAVDGSHLYFTRVGGGNIIRTNLSGTEQMGLPFQGQDIAVDANHLYWTGVTSEGLTNTIGRSNLDGENAEENFIVAQSPQGLAVDANHIYWGAHPSGRGRDLYRYEAASGDLADLTPDSADLRGAEVMGVLGASEDASYVYFTANGVLASNVGARGTHASPGNCGEVFGPGGVLSEFTGSCNLYLWHGGTSTFIARLDADGSVFSDGANWVTSNKPFQTTPFVFAKTARVSADGHTLLFRSRNQLTAYDNEGPQCVGDVEPGHCLELYRYRVGDSGPTCISCNPTGDPPSGPATLGSIEPPVLGASAPAAVLSRNLSADGDRVFFETTDALVAADTDGDEGCPPWGSRKQELGGLKACQDVYEWEANGSGSCHSEAQDGGCLYLISTGKSPDASFFADASASGGDVFFFTPDRLVGQDEDGLTDVYDAREGGGLKSQNEVPPVPCEGEGCKRGAGEAPAFLSLGTPGFSGPPNPSSRPSSCRKGSARKHGRCVKRHHKRKSHHRRHDRDAKTTGRAGR